MSSIRGKCVEYLKKQKAGRERTKLLTKNTSFCKVSVMMWLECWSLLFCLSYYVKQRLSKTQEVLYCHSESTDRFMMLSVFLHICEQRDKSLLRVYLVLKLILTFIEAIPPCIDLNYLFLMNAIGAMQTNGALLSFLLIFFLLFKINSQFLTTIISFKSLCLLCPLYSKTLLLLLIQVIGFYGMVKFNGQWRCKGRVSIVM